MSLENTLPRKGSVMFNFMYDTDQNKKKTANRYRLMNKYFVVPLYRLNILSLFLIGKIILLVYAKGRKSGKTRITPVEYRTYNDTILLFSARGKKSDWYQNITSHPDSVRIKKGFRKFKPEVRKSTDEEKITFLQWYMDQYPKSAKTLFGYQKKIDTISDDLTRPLAEHIEILQLKI